MSTSEAETARDAAPRTLVPRRPVPALGRVRETWSRFRRNRLAVAGLVLLTVMVVLALAAPVIAPEGPFKITSARLKPPTAEQWFGTDHLGRDVWAGVAYGTGTSILVGLLSVVMAISIGVAIGSIAGYFGGRVDDLLMRFTEVFQVMPRFFLALVVVAIFGANLWGIIFVIGILNWAELARLIRAEFLTLKERPFVTAARAYGAGHAHIIIGEILPNAMSPVIVAGSLQVASSILLEAALGFLGVGDPNVMSLGTMLNTAQQYLRYAWWTAVFPGVALCLLTLGIALISDGLNDALNPRLKEMGA
jgi:peptide/nickel transport system permease protein